MPLSVFDNIAKWAGAFLSPASNTAGDGTEIIPAVRVSGRKFTRVLTNTPLGASATYYSPWFDSSQSGTQMVMAVARADQNGAGSGFVVQGTNSFNGAIGFISLASYGPGGTYSANTTTPLYALISTRYWRVGFGNGATAQTNFELSVVEMDIPSGTLMACGTGGAAGFGLNIFPVSCNAAGGIAVTTLSASSVGDGQTAFNTQGAPSGNAAVPLVALSEFTSGSSSSLVGIRTPAIFRSAMGSASLNTVWTPASAKKFRMMKYKIEAEADMHVTSGTTAMLSLLDGGLGAGFQHLIYIPTSGGTALNGYWESDWIDLGNGYLSSTANNTLQLGISGPLSSTTQAPAFAQTSGQWEAGQLLFKTSGTSGAVGGQAIQAVAATPVSATSVAKAYPAGNTAGNTLVVICAEKNATTTLTIADTISNSWTAATAAVNATDGVTTRAFYCVNCKSTAAGANTVTVTGTAVASQMKMIILEYSNVSAFDTGASAGDATGNNAAPTATSQTAAATSDLVIAYASNGQSSNAITAGTGYTSRLSSSDTNSTLAVEDSLYQVPSGLAGAFNVIAIGTEE